MKRLRVQSGYLKDGEVEIHGYKHAMVQIVAASIALNIPVVITNAPLVDDTFVFQAIIEKAGGTCTIEGHVLSVNPRGMTQSNIDTELSKKIHGSLYLMPAFAIRFDQFSFGESGGCQIGSLKNESKRPVDHMLGVMARFGIETRYEDGIIMGKKEAQLQEISLDIMDYSESREQSTAPMVSGATKTALLCAIGAKHSKILHPYLKTDVQDLVRFLKQCGYQIELSKEAIEVKASTAKPVRDWVEFHLTECVSEIMTYIALAAHVDINLLLRIRNIELIKKGLSFEFDLLKRMGIDIRYNQEEIFIDKIPSIQSINIDVTNDTIQSDHHPFFALMLLRSNQPAQIREFVWKDRFAYVNELTKLGADLIQEGNVLYIRPSHLTLGNQTLNAADTRAAAILILASLTAQAPVEIENVQHLYRGYEDLLGTLESLGADLILESALLV